MAMKKKQKKTKRRRISIAQAVRVKEITVRYGGVIKTGNYENRRLSFEVTEDVPRYVNIDRAIDYIEAIAMQQFYEAQIKELQNLPEEMRDEIDVSKMTPGEAAAAIVNYLKTFGSGKQLTEAQRTQRIEQIDKELKELAKSINAETKRLRKIKDVTGDDLHNRALMLAKRDALKKELKNLRR